MNTLIIETLVVLLFSAFFSGLEIAFVSSSKLGFEMDRDVQGFTARIIDLFYRHPNHFISTLLVGNNIALVVYGILMAEVIDQLLLIPLGLKGEDMQGTAEVACLLVQTLLSTLVVSLDHFSILTNLSGVLACFQNIGPGLELVGPSCNFAGFSTLSKLVLCGNMLAGRLEIFPMLVLLSRSTWFKR